MSRIRLYIDEDALEGYLVKGLRARSVDVVTAADACMMRRKDEEHLLFAKRENRALYSFNIQHFHKIHCSWLSEGRSHNGMILGQQQRYSAGEQMRRLIHLLATISAEEMIDREEFLSAW